jgi:hypothetical protein
MRTVRTAVCFSFILLTQGCVGVFYLSGTSGTPDYGVYRLLDPDVLGIAPPNLRYPEGIQPYAAADGSLFYVKRVSGVYQVHRNGMQVTTSPGNKSFPAYSNGRLAYEVEDASSPTGKRIGLKQMPNGPESVLPYAVNGGLDLFDGAKKLAFTRDDGVYLANVSPTNTELPIAACSVPNLLGPCSAPVASHDGRRIGWAVVEPDSHYPISGIYIVNTEDWDTTAIWHNRLCPTCIPGQPGSVDGNYRLGFDFSPDDESLYVSAAILGVGGPAQPRTRQLYRIKLDGTEPTRLTNNGLNKYRPTTKRCVLWFLC